MYLRIVVMYLSEPEDGAVEPAGPWVRVPAAAAAGLVGPFVFTVVVGFLPGEVIDFARDAVPVLVAGP